MKNTKQASLFGDMADADQARGFKAKDDVEFERERKRMSRGKGSMPPAPATGPACIRCERWRPPLPGLEYGTCSFLVRLNERYQRLDLDVGTVISLNQADRYGIDDWSYLRMGGGGTCSAYTGDAASTPAPDILPTPVIAGSLIDRIRNGDRKEAA